MPRGDDQFQQFIATRKNAPPEFLFKYANVETARAVLETGKLRFQSPLRYNDPFDTQWDPFWQLRTDEAGRMFRDRLVHALLDPTTWPSKIDERLANEYREHFTIHRLSAPWVREQAASHLADQILPALIGANDDRTQFANQQMRLRMQCLSSSVDSRLLWSHYADEHRGVVLVLSTHTLETTFKHPVLQVDYASNPPEMLDLPNAVDHFVFGTPMTMSLSDMAEKMTATKHSDWKNEREWRFVWIEEKGSRGLYTDVAFPAEALAGLLIGIRAGPRAVTELKALARAMNPGVTIGLAKPDPYGFGVAFDDERARREK